jgi:hypothetical protein
MDIMVLLATSESVHLKIRKTISNNSVIIVVFLSRKHMIIVM